MSQMNVWVRGGHQCVGDVAFDTVELIFCLEVKKGRRFVAWELGYCVLHFLFFGFFCILSTWFIHVCVERRNRCRTVLLHTRIVFAPLFWMFDLNKRFSKSCWLLALCWRWGSQTLQWGLGGTTQGVKGQRWCWHPCVLLAQVKCKV